MADDGVFDASAPVVLTLQGKTLEAMRAQAEQQGTDIDTLASMAVEVFFDPRSMWDQFGYTEEQRKKAREEGWTEETFDAVVRGRASRWPRHPGEARERELQAKDERFRALLGTCTGLQDLYPIEKDGSVFLTLRQLLTRENEEVLGRVQHTEESFFRVLRNLESASNEILERADRAGGDERGVPERGRRAERPRR